MAESLTLPGVCDELYAGPPEDFVSRRNERAKQARAAKDRELAAAITALRRPSRSAWMVNLLARTEPEQLAGLLDLGEALRQAQQELSGPDLRRLSSDRHRAVEALTRRAVALAAEQDATASEATRREISQTLQAALADPSTADLVRAGTLVQAADYSGFGPLSAAAGVISSVPPPEPEDAEGVSDGDAEAERAARAEREEREERARVAREAELEAARARAGDVEAAAQRARQQRDEVAAGVDRATVALADLKDRLQDAERQLTAAEQDREQAQLALQSLQVRQQQTQP